MTVSVFVVDDHPVVRSGLIALLSAQSNLEIVGEADSGEEALRKLTDQEPQVVLTDLKLL